MIWPGYHVQLVDAVLDARTDLRRILPAVSPEHQRAIGRALARLNSGLKARTEHLRKLQTKQPPAVREQLQPRRRKPKNT
jgi:hypothetical protein